MSVRARRVLLLLAVIGSGCGARSGLDGRGVAGQAGNAATDGGSFARGGGGVGGGASGGVAGTPSAGRPNGGRAGAFGGGVGGVSAAGEASAGEPAGGEPPAEGGSAGAPPLPNAVRLALGAFHSCAGFDDASLRCWGTGGYIGAGNKATIGDDETPAATGAVDIGGGVMQISASWYHTCAVLDDGHLRCFGNGADGKLGYGNVQNIGDDEAPATAGDVKVGDRVRQVSAGPYHTCAVLMSGKVRCWGKNDHHQLGYASSATIGDDELPTAAGLVDVGGRVTQVATGLAYSCALLSTGSVRCWGDNLAGGLGYPGVTSVGDDETPAAAGDVDVGGKVTQLVVGMLHTCALLENGKVRCWGSPADGRLGYANANAIGDDETPAAAGDVDVGGKVTQLAAGDYATCALLETGKVRCWGAGMRGELGHASLSDIGDDETPASAGDIDVGGVVTLVDVGFLHVCVTLESGSVRCWGRGETAALGYGNLLVIGDDETPAGAGDVRFF